MKRSGEKMSGAVISGVFCDVDGTFLDFNGNINLEVAEMLERYAAEGKTVTLWSGGDPKEIKPKLKGIKWPFVSKYDFEGRTVEIAIDDIPRDKFEDDYGIKVLEFIHYDPYEIWKERS